MTQLSRARSGEITPEIRHVAHTENIPETTLLEYISNGWVVIPKNTNHDFSPMGIGKGLRTKVNANIGTSPLHCDIAEEINKLNSAVNAGTDSIMDLSTGGSIDDNRRLIIEKSPVMVGTVPVYQVMAGISESNPGCNISADDIISAIRKQAEDGVDYITIHCGITLEALEILRQKPRLGGIVSRGGSFISKWMSVNRKENPLYENFSAILDIAFEYDVTLSMGDGLRPGAIADAGDAAQIHELVILGKLARIARNKGVQVMIEGPGHVPLDQIVANIQIQKTICDGAPFYVLGPIPTDIAPGYDHITSAIGGAIASAAGADFLCYVTPAEHLKLPDVKDVHEGVIAARIAAHAGDIAKGIPGALDWDLKMSRARSALDWEKMYKHAIDGDRARSMRRKSEAFEKDECSMCGHLCSIKNTREENVGHDKEEKN